MASGSGRARRLSSAQVLQLVLAESDSDDAQSDSDNDDQDFVPEESISDEEDTVAQVAEEESDVEPDQPAQNNVTAASDRGHGRGRGRGRSRGRGRTRGRQDTVSSSPTPGYTAKSGRRWQLNCQSVPQCRRKETNIVREKPTHLYKPVPVSATYA